jgi:DNA-binding PadR family transcriptional regulator
MNNAPRRSPLALAVLALVVEAPMHPYQMQQEIRRRGKDEVINVGQRASLYKTIDRLHRDGLIAVRETSRQAQRPERTVYQSTAAGRDAVREWLREMLSAPRKDFPEFPAAIAHLPLLDHEDAIAQLDKRRAALAADVAKYDTEITFASGPIPRLLLLETEYLRAVGAAELAWVDSIIADLRAERITWTPEWLARTSARLAGLLGGKQAIRAAGQVGNSTDSAGATTDSPGPDAHGAGPPASTGFTKPA